MAVAEDFSFEERQEQERMVLESVDRFLDKDVAPYAHALEADDTYPQEIVCLDICKDRGTGGDCLDVCIGYFQFASYNGSGS